MRKLRVNKNIFNKGKMVLIPISLVGAILLNGCDFIPNGDRARYPDSKINTSISTTVEPTVPVNKEETELEDNVESNSNNLTTSSHIIPMKTVQEGNLSQTKINFTSANYDSFTNYLDSITVYYDYEELYDFDTTLNEYNTLILVNNHNSDLKNITVDELYNLVLKNNKEYKTTVKTSLYKELSSGELRGICELIVSTVNDFLENNSDISIQRVKCVLSDLKILVQKSSINNAFVTDNNCLIVSPNMLQIASMINGKGTEDDVIIHEISHLLQKGCNCDLEKNPNLKRNFGISYGFNNVKVNSLDFTWLYEASAEKNMVNYTGHEILVYKNMIGYLESLSLVNLLNDKYEVNSTEELSYKSDLNELYTYFGVTSEENKKEILNMMYSIEVMQNAPDDFYKVLEAQTGKTKDSNLVDDVNYTVKVSICETLTKLFYKNLSKNIVDKNVTLEDIFYLISLFENDLNSHIKYKDSTKYEYNERFINTYIDIQDNFFYQLSLSIDCSQEDVESKFKNYTANIKLGDGLVVKNYSLIFLDSEKVKYLNEREKDLNLSAAPSIKNTSRGFIK